VGPTERVSFVLCFLPRSMGTNFSASRFRVLEQISEVCPRQMTRVDLEEIARGECAPRGGRPEHRFVGEGRL